MRIFGRGLLARSLRQYEHIANDAVVYAKGVASSLTSDPSAYERELGEVEALIEGCRASGERFVYFSGGGAIYGNAPGPRCEGDELNPGSQYGRHQVACEALIRDAVPRYLIARLPNLVGRGQNPEQLVPNLVSQALRGHARLYRDATRDLLGADDAARMVASLLSHDEPQLVVNVASGMSTPVEQIFSEIERIAGTNAAVELLDGGDPQIFSIERMRELLDDEVRLPPDYPKTVLALYVPSMVGELVRTHA